jgi:hypothetical protein
MKYSFSSYIICDFLNILFLTRDRNALRLGVWSKYTYTTHGNH